MLSNKIALKLLELYPDECKVVDIKMLHTAVVHNYVMGIEKAHKRAAKSKIQFGEQPLEG